MFKKSPYVLLLLSAFIISSCGEKNEKPTSSMEQLHAENGIPVSLRKLIPEDFSSFLKYPAIIYASSESSVYAGLDDVVRTISVKVGDMVKQGDTIVSFSPDNRALQQASLAYDNALTVYERSNSLFRSNDISQQDFDTVQMQYEISAINLKAANDMVNVKAPISGMITQINVRVTENVKPGTSLFTVSNSDVFEALLYVGANEIENIQIGARAYIDGQNIEGRITQVSFTLDRQKQCFPVTAVFNDGNNNDSINSLVSGMNVDIAIEIYRNEHAIILSQQELVRTETGPVAFIVENNKLHQIMVQTGVENGLRTEIINGLSEGDMIVSEGVHQINIHSMINIVPSILSDRR